MFHHKYAKVDKQGKCLVAWDWLSGVRDGCAIFDWLLQLIMLGWIHKIMLVSTFYIKETLKSYTKYSPAPPLSATKTHFIELK